MVLKLKEVIDAFNYDKTSVEEVLSTFEAVSSAEKQFGRSRYGFGEKGRKGGKGRRGRSSIFKGQYLRRQAGEGAERKIQISSRLCGRLRSAAVSAGQAQRQGLL